MLRNSGPYGPNDIPITTETSIDVSQSSHNIKSVGKISQQVLGYGNNQLNIPGFPQYNYSQVNPSTEYPNMSPISCHPAFYSQMSQQTSFSPWSHGTRALDYDVQSQLSRFNEHLNLNYSDSSKNLNLSKNLSTASESILNDPSLVVRQHHPAERLKTEYQSTEDTREKTENMTKTKTLIDAVKRKSLENTVRLIENILINTVKNNEKCKQNSITNNSRVPKLPPEFTTSTNNNEESKDIAISNNCDQLIPALGNLNKLQFIKEDNVRQDTSDNEVSENIKDPLQIKTECTEDSSGHEQESKLVDSLQNSQCIDPNIVIKVEQLSLWSDIIDNPFLKDMHGVSKDEAGNIDIFDATISLKAAMESISNGAQSNHFECPHCSLIFRHPKRFLIHTKWHSFGLINERRQEVKREKKMNCRKRKQVKSEEENCEDPKKFPCKECGKEFQSKSSLKNHKYKVHPNPLLAKECPICHELIQGSAAMQAHKLTHQADNEFKCKECPKVFKYSHSLQKHMGVHLEKTHQCPDCPKAFGSTNLLKMHMKCHERALKGHSYRCTFCGKGFYEVYCLQVHERTHTGERPFVCNICNTSFNTNSGLNRHLKVSHSPSKPFSCTTCHRSFVTSSIRDRHELRAHGDPALFHHVCQLCPCKYLSAKYLRKHMDKVHPKSKVKKKKSNNDDDGDDYDINPK